MKYQRIAAAALVAFTALSSQAASTAWGSHDLLESALGLSAGGPISDTFAFTLSVQSNLASSVTTLGSITGGSYSLYSVGLDTIAGTPDDVAFGTWAFSGAPVVHTVNVVAGSYFYEVTGTASGLSGYSINSAASPTPVPEPETYALLAAGLGVIGFVASRRRRDH